MADDGEPSPYHRFRLAGIVEFLKEAHVVIEAWRTSPPVIELLRRVQDPHVFLRMATVELRRIAEQAPDIAVELRHVAQQLDAEAEDLARRNTE